MIVMIVILTSRVVNFVLVPILEKHFCAKFHYRSTTEMPARSSFQAPDLGSNMLI